MILSKIKQLILAMNYLTLKIVIFSALKYKRLMKLLKHNYLLLLALLISCNSNTILESGLESVSESIESKYAPDKRVAIYAIDIDSSEDKILLFGETDSKVAYKKLIDSIKSVSVDFVSKVRILPDTAVGNNVYAIARNSVINIRSAPKHAAELGTQGLLGMPLKVLDKKGDFYRVQTPDNYISWVDKGGITTMNQGEFESWNTAEKIIFTKNFGYVYSAKNDTSEIVSDITLGGILKYIDEDRFYYTVAFPDKRTGFVKKEEAQKYSIWLTNNSATQENVAKTALSMTGFPYLWGGTSAKGVDCSGFTKMVYFMNGYIIPRDASQQIHAGKIVDKKLNFSNLQKGDLLFFGKKATDTKKQRVTHVGIWLGNDNQEYIHASGNVHISSMDENNPLYDAFNKNRYLGSRRYLGVKDEMIVDLKK
ncbi:C40 family peptidase [uncultured Polaribacter sp.]|uniref:C40 family peptidase n=1 Tax=uncultured Polaribacter sp. TaxID=174711 RepID=UPI00261068E8|nr:C40 family peptidase [uncultured Polaribacter sp.]